MKILNINELNLGLEQMELADRLKEAKLYERMLVRVAGFFGVIGRSTYNEADLDMRLVEKLKKYPEHVTAISEWILTANYELLDELKLAVRDIGGLIPQSSSPVLYRGFSIVPGRRNMGVPLTERMFRKPIANLRVGDKFHFTPEKLMSLTSSLPVAKGYGEIVVSCNTSDLRGRSIHLAPEAIWAERLLSAEAGDPVLMNFIITYNETVVLPGGEPIEFTVEQIKK